MSTEVDAKIIKKTQDSLGKIIKKPTLTDKLLSRPPFRFLHDICTSVIRSTGLMKGLYSQEELNADNVKDKDAKLAFLQKLVDYLTAALGRQINVRIMSIIAGKEPEKTNELLCCLAEAVNKGVNNEEVVSRVLHGKSGEHGPSKKKSSKNPEHESKEQAPHGHESKKHKKVRKEEVKTEEKTEKCDPPKPVEDTKPEQKTPDKKTIPEKKEKEPTESGRKSHQQMDTNSQPGNCGDLLEKPSEDHTITRNQTPSEPPARIQRPISAKGQRIPKEEPKSPVPQEQEQEPKQEFVPNTRLAPPRPRKTSEITLDESQKHLNLTGRRVSGLIISDNQSDEDDEDEDDSKFAIEETVGGGLLPNNPLDAQTVEDGEFDPNQQHGGLVTKMLKSKKEFEGGNLLNQTLDSQPANVTGLNDATRERERAKIKKEIGKLCESLQSLSRSALPLGKLMDFVQEDLDSMQQEYERWKSENQSLKTQLKREESLTHSSIEPLKAQLDELEHFAEEKRKAIMKFKAKILHNDDRIQDLLTRSLEKVA